MKKSPRTICAKRNYCTHKCGLPGRLLIVGGVKPDDHQYVSLFWFVLVFFKVLDLQINNGICILAIICSIASLLIFDHYSVKL